MALQLAIPNKGALSEDSVRLLREAGYRCTRSGRELIVSDRENEAYGHLARFCPCPAPRYAST